MTEPRSIVWASVACAVAWLAALLLFGFSVTDRDGKAAVVLLLVLLSLAGSLFGVTARLGHCRHATLALVVNLVLGAFSVLSAVAVLT